MDETAPFLLSSSILPTKNLELLSVFMMVAFALEQFLVFSSWQPSSIFLSLLAILAIFYLTVGIRHRLANRGLVSAAYD